MKKITGLFAVLFVMVQAGNGQVLADFETDIAGFYDNGWGSGFSSVEQIADPTSASAGVLALHCDASLGEKGVIQADNVDPMNAETIDVDVWLPADFPDGGWLKKSG